MDQHKGFRISVLIEGEERVLSFPEGFACIGDSPGDSSSNRGTFSIPGRGLKKEALTLTRVGDEILVHNLANDPFCLINGEPFFKKKVSKEARIKIKHLEIAVHDLRSEEIQKRALPLQESSILPNLEEKVIYSSKEVEVPEKAESKEPSPGLTPALQYREEKEEPKKSAPFRTLSNKKIPWKSFLSFAIASSIFIGAIIGFEHYLRLYNESKQEELRAAMLLSDIAMAIASAQLYHITPERHDWSDPDFLQKNLIALLENPPQLASDESGLFIGPFRIRVYTSQDLSRFLLIATPSPTPLQWLIPKKSLAIDSNSMSIRKLADVKTLNRLLAPMTTLDGANNYLVNKHLSHGEIVPLRELAKHLDHSDFAPPTLAAFLRPGSENLIYNAPRYRAFGQAILEKGRHFTSVITSSHEMLMLRSELEVLQKFPHLILYTETPLLEAKLSFNTLKRISPDSDFILARVFAHKNRTLQSIELILDTSLDTSQEESIDLLPPTPRILLSQSLPITPSFGEIDPLLLGLESPEEEIAFSIPDSRELLQARFEEFLKNPTDESLQIFLEDLSTFKSPPAPTKKSLYNEQFWNSMLFPKKENRPPLLPSSKINLIHTILTN